MCNPLINSEFCKRVEQFAEENGVDGYFDAGNLLLDSNFGEQWIPLAAYFFKKAAEKNHADAAYELGLCYRWGEGGVYADPSLALEWFAKAAELGNEKAAKIYNQFNSDSGKLMMLQSAISGAEGFGSKWYKSKTMVEQYIKKAQEGDAETQYELARQLENTNHIWPFSYDIEKSVYWYTQAGNKGVVDAMYNLAVIYKNGRPGLEPNSEKAKYWFKKCADSGDSEAAMILKRDYPD